MRAATFVELTSAEECAHFIEAWERLAEAPLERNLFAEPFMLLPALEHLSNGEPVRVGLVLQSDPTEVIGVFPFVRAPRWHRLPVGVAGGWIHEQSYLGTPLLHRDSERAKLALATLLDAFATVPLLELNDVSGDGPFMHLLTEVLSEKRLPSLVTYAVTRPVLRPRASADAYLNEAQHGDARRKLRSKERGLAQLGALRTELVNDEPALEIWLRNFILLEASGWKSQKGSALAQKPEARAYFEHVLREAFRRQRVMALTLFAGERPVAVKLNLRSGDEWFAHKIAFENEVARFSPGLLLEIEHIRRVHELGNVRWVDSCTGPSVRVFRDVWLERRLMQNVLVATGGEPGPLALASFPLLRHVQRKTRVVDEKPEGHANYKPPPRQAAALPLASKNPLAKRIAATPLALATAELAGARSRPGELGTIIKHAVRLQCRRLGSEEFRDHLSTFFAELDLDALLGTLNYSAVRPELLAGNESFIVHGVNDKGALDLAVKAASRLSIRLEFQRLRAGQQMPPHGHARVVSGFVVVEGRIALRRYDIVESSTDSLTLKPSFDGVLEPGQSSTQSPVRDNVHWLIALSDAVLCSLTVSHTPEQSPIPTSLNVWVDPRAKPRGDGRILAKWIQESDARKIPPFVDTDQAVSPLSRVAE
jgi:hypothetical protein